MKPEIKAAVLCPVLGGTVASAVMGLYLTVLNHALFSAQLLLGIVGIMPLVLLVSLTASYLLSFMAGYPLVKLMNERLWSDNAFIAICSLAGLLLGVLLGITSFYLQANAWKSLLWASCLTLMSIFNASFYVSLKKTLSVH